MRQGRWTPNRCSTSSGSRSDRRGSSALSSPTRCCRARCAAARSRGPPRQRRSSEPPVEMTSQAIPVREVSAAEALELAAGGYRIIDVREPVEWNEGHIPSATLIPLADVPDRIGVLAPDRSAPLLVHCAVGARSLRAAAYLNRVGYMNVASLRAPIAEWRRLGGAWEAPEQLLTAAQQRRYARQLPIPEIGQAGQRRLLDGKVLVIGAGGLGSPVSLYLAASGIGTIGLVDDDVVEESNLHRQVLHASER